MISISQAGMVAQGVRFLLPVIVCQTLKNRKKILSGLNTLFNTGQADRPCSNKPSKFKKKGCEKHLFLIDIALLKQS